MRDENTLGGYFDRHERPPAFEGQDGNAYSVSIIHAEEDEPEGCGAALMFVRWSASGDAPVGHVETPYLVFGSNQDDATFKICELSLHEVKNQLDGAIEVASKRSEW